MEKDRRPQGARAMVEARRLGRRHGRGLERASLVVVGGLVLYPVLLNGRSDPIPNLAHRHKTPNFVAPQLDRALVPQLTTNPLRELAGLVIWC